MDSTQEVVRALAAAGGAEGTVVVAEHQTAGRGRRGRPWVAPARAGVLVSVLLRPPLPPARWPELSLTAGLAVAEALAVAAGCRPRVKWPNDVLVAGRKVAGILVEGSAGPGSWVAVGVGVNVAGGPEAWAGAGPGAGSLEALGHPVARSVVLRAVLGQLRTWYLRLLGSGLEPVRQGWQARGLWGQVVVVDDVEGETLGLAPDGRLLVRQADGQVRSVGWGEVRLLADPECR